jgi:hypothetical protein
MDALPDAFLLPALEPPVSSGVVAVLLREVTPRTVGAQHVEDSIQGAAVIGTGTTNTITGWQQRLEDRPLGISQVSHGRIVRRQGFETVCR